MEPRLVSLVTSCMNRHDHLRQTLPTWLSKGFAEIVVLDWSSDPPIQQLVDEFQDGTISVVELRERQIYFHHAKSKNLRIRLARHPVVCALDCDVKIVADDFLARHPMDERWFYSGGATSLGGSGIFWKPHWQRVCGCDETMAGWGFEDWDICKRMHAAGVSWKRLRVQTLEHIPHDQAARTRHLPPGLREPLRSNARNRLIAQGTRSWQQEPFAVRIHRPGEAPVEALV